mmetsp:Transcript_5934/g.13817  ORF Transcript_5934/g.13817 Transcript_5934/m.13817 type:complete len:91 (-) Transcript_5934:404-676(-)
MQLQQDDIYTMRNVARGGCPRTKLPSVRNGAPSRQCSHQKHNLHELGSSDVIKNNQLRRSSRLIDAKGSKLYCHDRTLLTPADEHSSSCP